MGSEVLVAYGTKYGATAGIAERIGSALREAGVTADVRSADKAGDPVAYRAVVVGSAVYMGQWRKEAVKFVKANERALAERPVWVFSSGPTEPGDPAELLKGWLSPKGLQTQFDAIGPREFAVFGGVAELDKLNPAEGWIFKKVKAQFGDYRDWEAIDAWAGKIAASLQRPPA